MSTKLYVGNLSFKTSEDEIRSAFGQFGNVTDVYVAMDKMTGRPRGFAFVTFSTPDEAKQAAEKLNGTDLGGRALTVNEARPKEWWRRRRWRSWFRRRRRRRTPWRLRRRRRPWRRSPLLICLRFKTETQLSRARRQSRFALFLFYEFHLTVEVV
jgi:RNA recognition motif-containing protein